MHRRYRVVIKKKVQTNLRKMPEFIQKKLATLIEQLKENGPIAKDWPNFSKIGSYQYHCHLSYSWIACWGWEKGTVIIEVYYVGSRENAPY